MDTPHSSVRAFAAVASGYWTTPGYRLAAWGQTAGMVLLGVVNALVRPVVTVITFPITIVTLGLFLLVVNAAMIGLTAWFLKGFTVDGLASGVLAAIVTGAVSWIGQALLKDARQ